MYGILCATREELTALRDRLDFDPLPERHGPTQIWRGASAGRDLVLAQMGIGKVNAAAAATLLLGLFEVEALICSGVAGGLNPELPVGAVVLGERLAIHDYGIVAAETFTATASGLLPIGAPALGKPPLAPEPVRKALARLEAVSI